MLLPVLFLLLIASALISGSETVLFSLGKRALEGFRTAESVWGRRVHRVMQHPRRCLLTILLANNLVNVSIFTLAFVVTESLGQTRPMLSAAWALGVLLAVIVFCEMLPKGLALANADRLAPPAALIVSGLEVVLAPARWVLATLVVDPIVRLLVPVSKKTDEVTHEELKLLLEQSAIDGVIDSKENEMLVGAVGLASTSVREVMTPRVDLQSVPLSSDAKGARNAFSEAKRTDLLVRGRDLDDLHGVLHARDFHLNPRKPIRALLRPIHYVPEQVNLVQLLRHFRAKRIQSAVVVDEYGGTAGVVSLVDVTQRIIGDVGEADATRPVEIEVLDEHTYRLPGDFSVRVWADRFGVREIDGHIDTIAGLILSRLGRLPKPGDFVRIRNLSLTVERMNHRRIATVVLRSDHSESIAAEMPR